MANELRRLTRALKPGARTLNDSERELVLKEARKMLIRRFKKSLDVIDEGYNKKKLVIKDENEKVIANLDLFFAGTRAHFYNLWVGDEESESDIFRNLGMARQIMEFAKKYAKKSYNVRRVTLSCAIEKIPLYEKFGFKVYESFGKNDVNM